MATGRELHAFDEPDAVTGLGWSHDGRRLYAVDHDGRLSCFDFALARPHDMDAERTFTPVLQAGRAD